MITNACAAMNLFAWLFFQKLSVEVGDGALFEKMISDSRFFGKGQLIGFKTFYKHVRCGVVHQFYPKRLIIAVHDSDVIFGTTDGWPAVNALAFYRSVLKGLKVANNIVQAATGSTLEDFDFKLLLRQKIDEEQANDAEIDFSNLPKFESRGWVINA